MTTLMRWDPFDDMLSLRDAMNRLVEESFVRPGMTTADRGFVPAVDISETPDQFIVEATVPGLKPEDLEITLENSVLTIKGTLRQEREDTRRNYHRIERRFGAFQRTISFPRTVKADAIVATMEQGILRIAIPKAEESKARRIAVSATEKPMEIEANR